NPRRLPKRQVDKSRFVQRIKICAIHPYRESRRPTPRKLKADKALNRYPVFDGGGSLPRFVAARRRRSIA
ncbi:MAG TPA: hypothetical protein VKU03_12775, partial [Roseiarcus sp.]|nr:hypothetical protein [Roseiarcus sp.]